jgi:FkbM family methyltransferase
MAKDLPTYVINRACDTDRLARFEASATAAVSGGFTRVNGLDGHNPDAPLFLYRDMVGPSFWGQDQIKPGAFACYLSHMAAWARMLGEGHEAALICEDDIALTGDLTALATQVARHHDFDVIFANDRMTDWRGLASAEADGPLISAQMVIDRMHGMKAAPGTNGLARGPGADAYVISARGAEAMLERSRKLGVIAGVDWMLLAQGLTTGGLAAEAGENWPELAFLSPQMSEPPLTVLVAEAPIGLQGDAPSAIMHKITAPIARFCAADPVVRLEKDAGPQAIRAPLAFPKGPSEDPLFVTLSEGRLPEEPALAMMARWMPPGGMFIDIGAHVGTHTLFMLRHGGAGAAVAFEINKRVIGLLNLAVEANNLSDRVDLTQLGIAAGEERGKKEMFGAKREYSNARLREGFVEDIRVRPGAALLRDVAPDMIKIDVNGEERDVLKGLRKTLKQRRPLLAIDLTRLKSQKVFLFLERIGYREVERATWREGEGEDEMVRQVAMFSAGPIRDVKPHDEDTRPSDANEPTSEVQSLKT